MGARDHRNFKEPNFCDETGRLFLVRCFECEPVRGRENYGPMVAGGVCWSCGWSQQNQNDEPIRERAQSNLVR